MGSQRLTTAQAIVKWLIAQHIDSDGASRPIFPGVFAIFGHGNVTCLGAALETVKDTLPTWRGQNEQSMALAGVAFAKATRRRQIMVATSSIGPGATNMVTAAAVAHANRLPLLLLAGDVFANRRPDPVLQQLEHFHNPTLSANDAFRAVSRYWDRITHPEQILSSLPQALATMLDPADCGPAFLGLCQDIQAVAADFPDEFFHPRHHRPPRPHPAPDAIADAARLIAGAKRPLIIAGGGVRYSGAEATLAAFATRHALPVAETIAGRAVLPHDHPFNAGPIGVIGSTSANALAADADVVIAIGTRLQDFTTGSWSVFARDARIVALNAARFDAVKHRALPVQGDARASLTSLSEALADWAAPATVKQRRDVEYARWNATIEAARAPTNTHPPSYAQVIGIINDLADPTDLALCAAGGLPGELCKNWRAKSVGTFDGEFGYSCMGYEIAGGWGAAMADPDRDVIVFCGDGAYLMMNSDIYSSVIAGHKMIVILCDNGGFGVINRLQNGTGGASFNNLLADCRTPDLAPVDFIAHARAMGALGEKVATLTELGAAFTRAKQADRTYVIAVDTDPFAWTAGDAWWDVGVPEVSDRVEIRAARSAQDAARRAQRVGV